MSKLNVHTLSPTHSSNLEVDASVRVSRPDSSHRIVVLIPPDSDCSSMTRKICKLANENNSDVQLLGLCRHPEQEMSLRRELVTVSALIRGAKVFSELKVETGNNWVNTVQHNYQPGDIIVCITDPSIGIRKKPLSELLKNTLKAQVHVLSKDKAPQYSSNALSQIIAWSGFLGITIGFFIIQVKIVELPHDWFQTVLSILSLIPELGLILFWNSLF
jgi:hypothetical protein